MMPDTLRTGTNRNYIRITWENHGVAPAYKVYRVYIKLVNRTTGRLFVQQLTESDNRNWLPDEIVTEQYRLNLDPELPGGMYEILLCMRDECGFHSRNIQLGIKSIRETESGWYKLGEIMMKQNDKINHWCPLKNI
jgi:hypothetical protein